LIPFPYIALCICIILLIVERLAVYRTVHSIPVRILVNGTRGKSSVTEYIAAGLRANSRTVIAKITGIVPTMISPDGTRKRILRYGPARVQEQFRILNNATNIRADSMIFECMSIVPEYQRLESRFLSPTIYVITNILNDHQEELGISNNEHAEAICSAIPENAVVVTAERDYLSLIEQFAKKKNSTVIAVNEIPGQYASDIPLHAFEVNVALALEVCSQAGYNSKKTFQAIAEYAGQQESPLLQFRWHSKIVRFINGFPVNDVMSAQRFIKQWWRNEREDGKLILLFNSRKDRPLRSRSFAEWVSSQNDVYKVAVAGNHSNYFIRSLRMSQFPRERIIRWKQNNSDFNLSNLLDTNDSRYTIIGIGNIADEGFSIVNKIEQFKETSQ
jgi:poly-gamma-glutamate synthase PgsB/CapB